MESSREQAGISEKLAGTLAKILADVFYPEKSSAPSVSHTTIAGVAKDVRNAIAGLSPGEREQLRQSVKELEALAKLATKPEGSKMDPKFPDAYSSEVQKKLMRVFESIRDDVIRTVTRAGKSLSESRMNDMCAVFACALLSDPTPEFKGKQQKLSESEAKQFAQFKYATTAFALAKPFTPENIETYKQDAKRVHFAEPEKPKIQRTNTQAHLNRGVVVRNPKPVSISSTSLKASHGDPEEKEKKEEKEEKRPMFGR